MSGIAILSLMSAILKLAPEVVTLIEGVVGHGNPIAPEQLPHILTQVAELSKGSAPAAIAPIEVVAVPTEPSERAA